MQGILGYWQLKITGSRDYHMHWGGVKTAEASIGRSEKKYINNKGALCFTAYVVEKGI